MMTCCAGPLIICFLCFFTASEVVKGNGAKKGRSDRTKYKSRCCEMGRKLAKHGYTECKWSINLVKNVDRIDRQWKEKSPVTGAIPSDSLINLRWLRKCKRFKYTFNKCCETEKVNNEIFIKTMLIRWRQMSSRLQSKMYNDYQFNEELEKQLTEE